MVRASKPKCRSQTKASSKVVRRPFGLKMVVPLLLLLAVAGLVLVNVVWSSKPQTVVSPVIVSPLRVSIKPVELNPPVLEPIAQYDLCPQTLEELLKLPVNQLGKVDIGRMNLLCAVGLPGQKS